MRTPPATTTPRHCHPDTANVTISGLAGASGTPLPGAATVTVSAGFEVTPPTATCTAGSASVAPEAGSARIVARDVAAGTTATVTVTCTHGSNSATADAEFTARPAPQSGNCSSPLGTLASGTVTVAGSWIAGCESAHLGSPQAPHWAWSFTFAVAGAATVDVDVVSSEDPYLTVTADADGSIAGQDDDSGDDGRDARLRGLQLTRVSYTVEVTAAGPRTEGAFTLTLNVTGPPPPTEVTISGLAAADATPADAGDTEATVSDEFDVTPHDANCGATPDGATVTPADSGTRTVAYSVPEGTTVTVRVTCDKDGESASAAARFTAGDAPVQVSGLEVSSEPVGDAATAEVSDEFDVIPTGATCEAGPDDAAITPTRGGTRTVTLEVDAGETETVTVTCRNGTQTAMARATFTATDAGGCNAELGALSSAGVTVTSAISADDGCTSLRRSTRTDRTYHARRHVLVLTSPGWATVTLESAASNPQRLDTYLILLHGDALDGSGAKITHNDDASNASSHGLHGRDSRIAGRFLQTGTYTIEATTFRRYSAIHPQRSTGDYILRVSVDHTPRATSQPAELRVQNGNSITRTWAYEPGAATVAIASAFPDGITAAVSRYPGTTTSENGRATLTATPSKVGQFAALVTYANGTAALTKATTINSYCPDGQTELPSGCGTPLLALMRRLEQILVSPLPEHIVNLAQDCYRTSPSGEPDEWLCRRLQTSRVYISKTSDQIEGTSDAHVDYGTQLVLASNEMLEGCQSITSEHWQCDYRADWLWTPAEFEGSMGAYVLSAFVSGVLDPARCAVLLNATWLSAFSVPGVSPMLGASSAVSCGGLFVDEES